MTAALIQALSRLADNRQADGTSSLVSAEDRKTIVDGCYELMITARQNSTPRELFGPYAHLNGPRALPEDSWSVEDDPIENNEEYFSIPLFAQVEVTFPVTHGAPDAEAYRAYADELGQDTKEPSGTSAIRQRGESDG
jgi:hypothetical protein